MSSDLFCGQRIDLKDLAKQEGVHASTVWRWALRGISGVRLPTRRMGHKRWTTREAVEWGAEQITARGDRTACSTEPSERRQRQIEAAERKLAAMGI